jgi:hypothetical protein
MRAEACTDSWEVSVALIYGRHVKVVQFCNIHST